MAPERNDRQLQFYREATWLIRPIPWPCCRRYRACRLYACSQRWTGAQARQSWAVVRQHRRRSGTHAYASYWCGTRGDLQALPAALAPLPGTAAELMAVGPWNAYPHYCPTTGAASPSSARTSSS